MRRIRKKPFFDQFYKKVSPWGVKLGDRRLAFAISFFSGKGREKVLDVGCGEGILLAMLLHVYPKVEAYGVDVAEVALKRAKQSAPKAKFVKADAEKLPFPKNSFDWVFCLEILYYLSNFEKALREIKRVLLPGGKAVIGVTLGRHYFSYIEFRKILNRYFSISQETILFPRPLPQNMRILSGQTIMTSILEKIFPERLALKAYFVVKNSENG